MNRTIRVCGCFALWCGLLVVGCQDTVEHRVVTYDKAGGIETETSRLAYDAATVETVTGTIGKVEPLQKIERSRSGVRLLLQADATTYYVYLGPIRFQQKNDLMLNEGQEIEVRGSVVKGEDKPVIIASEITEGNRSVIFRDANGKPQW